MVCINNINWSHISCADEHGNSKSRWSSVWVHRQFFSGISIPKRCSLLIDKSPTSFYTSLRERDMLQYRSFGYGHSFGAMCHYYGREAGELFLLVHLSFFFYSTHSHRLGHKITWINNYKTYTSKICLSESKMLFISIAYI